MGKPNFTALRSFQLTAETDQEAADIIEAEGTTNITACIRDFRENGVTKFWNRDGQQVTIRKVLPSKTVYELASEYVEAVNWYRKVVGRGDDTFAARCLTTSTLAYLIDRCKEEA